MHLEVMSLRKLPLASLAALLGLLTACDDGETTGCGEGTVWRDGVCVVAETDEGGGTDKGDDDEDRANPDRAGGGETPRGPGGRP